MNLLASLAKKSFSWNRSIPSTFLWNPSPIPATESDASRNSAVMACVFWAMRNAGRATFFVEQGGEPTPHPLTDLLQKPQAKLNPKDRVNLSGRELIGALTYSRLLDGNAYAHKIRNADGFLIALEWIPHTAIQPMPSPHRANLLDSYCIATPAGQIQVPREDILHDRDGLDPAHPALGISRLKSVARHIQTDNQVAAYSQTILSNPIPSLIVSAKSESTRVTQEDAEFIAGKMREATSRDRAGGIIVPTFPAEITPVGFKPDDLAISHLNKLPEERISAVLGIPAVVAGLGAGLDRATYSNIKEAREAATEEFLIPLWQDLADTFTDQLLPEFGNSEQLKVSFSQDRR